MTSCITTLDADHPLPPAPPAPPILMNPPSSPVTAHQSDIKILQLNCFNTQPVIHEVLSLEDVDILLLQEP